MVKFPQLSSMVLYIKFIIFICFIDYSIISPTYGTDSSCPMNTDQWLPILKPFWDRGMTSWKATRLIAEAVHATGSTLDTERVKVSEFYIFTTML